MRRGRTAAFVLVLPFLAAPAVGSAQILDDTSSLPQVPSVPDPIEAVEEIEETVKDAVKATAEEGGSVVEGGATGTQLDAGTAQGTGSSAAHGGGGQVAPGGSAEEDRQATARQRDDSRRDAGGSGRDRGPERLGGDDDDVDEVAAAGERIPGVRVQGRTIQPVPEGSAGLSFTGFALAGWLAAASALFGMGVAFVRIARRPRASLGGVREA